MDFESIADALGPASLGLDIGVLDETGLERRFGDRGAACKRCGGITFPDPAVEQQVARLVSLHQRRARRLRGGDAHHRGQLGIADRQVGLVHCFDGRARADQGEHGLAAKAHHTVGQHRLILDVRVNAEAVAGHVACAEHAHHPRVCHGERSQIAELEARVMMGRAQHAQPQGVGGNAVGAVLLFTREFSQTVHLGRARADGRADRRTRREFGLRRVQHRLDDFLVSRTAAQHPAQGVLHLVCVGLRVCGEQIGCGDQHARRTNAALRRAVLVEGALQAGKHIAAGQAFHRGHFAPARLGNGGEAGTYLFSVYQYRAGAAIAGIATDLGPGQAEIVAQYVGKTFCRAARVVVTTAIDAELQAIFLSLAHVCAPSWLNTRFASVSAASSR